MWIYVQVIVLLASFHNAAATKHAQAGNLKARQGVANLPASTCRLLKLTTYETERMSRLHSGCKSQVASLLPAGVQSLCRVCSFLKGSDNGDYNRFYYRICHCY